MGAQEKAKGPGERRRPTVRWRSSGIQPQPRIAEQGTEKGVMPLPLLQYCLMHAVHEEVRDYLSGNARPVQFQRRIFVDFYSGCRSAEQRGYEPFQTPREWQ